MRASWPSALSSTVFAWRSTAAQTRCPPREHPRRGQPGGEVREHDRRRRHAQRREHNGDHLREPAGRRTRTAAPARAAASVQCSSRWTGPRSTDALEKEFEFESFPAAIAFVDRLAEVAEAEDHHPDIDIRYRRVLVRWSTHSAGGVTDKDRALAARTDELALIRRAPASTASSIGSPARISSVAASTLPQTSQSRKPRGLPASST